MVEGGVDQRRLLQRLPVIHLIINMFSTENHLLKPQYRDEGYGYCGIKGFTYLPVVIPFFRLEALDLGMSVVLRVSFILRRCWVRRCVRGGSIGVS